MLQSPLYTILMDSSIFFTILAAAIGFYVLYSKFRSLQETKETYSPSSSLPFSLSPSSVPPSPPSLSPSSVHPSSSSHNWIHDVFPSFRGEDVRRDFLSHIQKEFQRKGITPFHDNKIERGESIGRELIRAIRGSKIAIILISRNYASSKWCLEELVEIMKCREEVGQTVMAVFYKVDPSHVKKLAGEFGEVFRNTCKGKTKEDIRRWRQALEKVATIAGYDSSNWDNEAAMIENIAIDVSNKLINCAPSSDFDSLVGMEPHMDNMERILCLESNEVRMIGIWGPSGIGKSTIARVLFGEYSHEFQLSVFMENIKRRYPSPYYDEYSAKLQLQKDFLSQIINHDDIRIHHLGIAQDRLKHKKVLAVLDDIDHLVQLDAIAKENRWFGPESRIIITTQDKKILKAHGINHIYEVDFPPEDEAVEMFCMYAFGQNIAHDGFENLAWEVTKLSGRLPLGLKVMGSYFKGMSKYDWTKALPRVRIRLDGEIESILRFSYDALCNEDKDLFLYIACFFNNEQIEKVEEHLAKNFVDVRQGLHVLAEKSLISMRLGKVEMHNLLARLGKEIVRKQSIYDPGQRQFLCDTRDICQVLNNDTLGTRSVTCIDFKYYEIEDEFDVSERAFERMSNLQFLRVCWNDNIFKPAIQPRVYNIPQKVRLLHWEYCPMIRMPFNFNMELLVELNMPYSKLEKLWEGVQTIRNLKWVNFNGSQNLKELPPSIGNAINLQNLSLGWCSKLVEIPSSIGNLVNLKELKLYGCSSLVELPSSIGNLINLPRLNLQRCSSLMELPSSIDHIINLQEMNLNWCSSLVELPSSIGNLINLQRLYLEGCSSLVELPSSIGNLINLQRLYLEGCSSLVQLPSSIGNLINLQRLYLERCSSLVELPSSIGNLINLGELNLEGCSSLVELPSSIGNLINLRTLNLERCSSLVELPSSIGNVINLEELNLEGCSSLVELPSSIGDLINLESLCLQMCSSLVEIPSSIGNLVNLKELKLYNCSSLVELPSSIGNLINLPRLNLQWCSSLVELPSSIGNLINLQRLYLEWCSSLVELPSSIGDLINLKELNPNWCSSLVELPSSIGNLINLPRLNLQRCSSLLELPSSIDNIINLEELNLNWCSSLVELPSSIGNLINLQRLYLEGCSSLVELPSSIGDLINLEELDLGCSSLVELPSSIGNLINLCRLKLKGCSSLVELPSSIGNLINLEVLDLKGCSSLVELPYSIGNLVNLNLLYILDCSNLVELPSSIGNLQKLSWLDSQGCSKLEYIPVDINMESLAVLILIDCSSLKNFPEISTNISDLRLNGTAVEEIPSSIRSWSLLDELRMSYSKNLEKFPHAFECITELHLSDTRIQEIAPWVKELSCLYKLVARGCTKLVLLPQLPESLRILDAENCESLERLDPSFQITEFISLNFGNCFKMNKEARDLIQTSTCRNAVLPGEKVPTYFTYRANGSSLSMKLNGFGTHLPISLKFKACLLLVIKGTIKVEDWLLSYRITEKQNGVEVMDIRKNGYKVYDCPFLTEHLYIFEFGEEVSCTELVFEFESIYENVKIGECGIRTSFV